MAWTAPRTWVTGELVTASILNTHVRDNLTELRAGGFAVASQAIGDLLYASSTTQFARIAAVATGSVLKSAGTGTAPAWGTINVAFLSDGSNVALLNAANVFTGAPQTCQTSSSIAVKAHNVVGNGTLIQFKNYAATTRYNFFVGTNYNLTDTFEIIPSTAVGGDTPSGTSVLSITQAGLATVTGGVKVPAQGSTLGQWSHGNLRIHPAGGVSDRAQLLLGYDAGTYAPGSFGIITTTASGNTFGDFLWALRAVNTDTAPTEVMRLSSAGVLTVSGIGTHTFTGGTNGDQMLKIANTTSGNAARAILELSTNSANHDIIAYEDSYSTSGIGIAGSLLIYAGDVGGLSLAAANASGEIRFYTGGTTETWHMGTNNFGSFDRAWGATAIGSYISVGRNTSGSGAAGFVNFTDLSGTGYPVWVDASAQLRIVTNFANAPAADGSPSDTGGTVVGTQTSQRSVKNIYGAFTDNRKALREVLGTPLWRFSYKSGAYNRQRFVGITTDDSPVFGMDKGRSFNPVTAFGYTVAAFKAQQARIDALEQRLAKLERRMAA